MPDHFRIIDEQGVKVIELQMPAGADAADFDWLNQTALLEIDPARNDGWVLDLRQFAYVGSAALGFMINVRQRIRSGGGMLVLCEMSPHIASILRASSVGKLFTTAGTRKDAIAMIQHWRARRRR